MQIKTIGIIGHGAFGAYVVELLGRFAPEVAVRVYSRRATVDSETFYSLADTAAADAVLMCCPIHEYEETLMQLLTHVRNNTVIVDVATVKVHTSHLLRDLASRQAFISTHPMFGPESDKKNNSDVTGFRIVVTNHTLEEANYQSLKAQLEGLGFVVVEMSADEHDKQLAETLFLTHYIGQTMKAGRFLRTRIDTISFQSLMNAVESVMNDEQLFHDVYRFNPYCKEVAERFHNAQQTVYQRLPREE